MQKNTFKLFTAYTLNSKTRNLFRRPFLSHGTSRNHHFGPNFKLNFYFLEAPSFLFLLEVLPMASMNELSGSFTFDVIMFSELKVVVFSNSINHI